MPLKLNGVEIDKMYLNGTEVETGYLNGVEVFSSFDPTKMMYWCNYEYLVQFNTKKMRIENVLPVESQAAIEIGTDGYLYALGILNGHRSILRIKPETMAVTSSYVPPGIVIGSEGLMVGPGNTVYFSGYPYGVYNTYLYKCQVVGDSYYLSAPNAPIYGNSLSKGMMYSKSNDKIYTTFGSENFGRILQRCNTDLERESFFPSARTNGDRPVDIGSSDYFYSCSTFSGKIYKVDKNSNNLSSLDIPLMNNKDSIISDLENRRYIYACCYNRPIMDGYSGSNVVKVDLNSNTIVAKSSGLKSAVYMVDTLDGYLHCVDAVSNEVVKLRKGRLSTVSKYSIEDKYSPYLIYSNNSSPGYNIQSQV